MKYIVKCETVDEVYTVIRTIKKDIELIYHWTYVYIDTDKNTWKNQNYLEEKGMCYTFEQWKLKFMKTNKSYICPFDLAEGMVKAGTLYKRYKESLFYSPEGEESPYTLPQEIVEQWQEAPKFKVGDYVVVKNNTPTAFGVVQEGNSVKWINNRSGYGYKWDKVRLATEEEIREARKFKVGGYTIFTYSTYFTFGKSIITKEYLEAVLTLFNTKAMDSVNLVEVSDYITCHISLDKKTIEDILTKMKQW